MTDETEVTTATMTESGWQQDWTTWWQSYWSDAPTESAPEPARYGWRESAHEFDFGTDKSPYRDA